MVRIYWTNKKIVGRVIRFTYSDEREEIFDAIGTDKDYFKQLSRKELLKMLKYIRGRRGTIQGVKNEEMLKLSRMVLNEEKRLKRNRKVKRRKRNGQTK